MYAGTLGTGIVMLAAPDPLRALPVGTDGETRRLHCAAPRRPEVEWQCTTRPRSVRTTQQHHSRCAGFATGDRHVERRVDLRLANTAETWDCTRARAALQLERGSRHDATEAEGACTPAPVPRSPVCPTRGWKHTSSPPSGRRPRRTGQPGGSPRWSRCRSPASRRSSSFRSQPGLWLEHHRHHRRSPC